MKITRSWLVFYIIVIVIGVAFFSYSLMHQHREYEKYGYRDLITPSFQNVLVGRYNTSLRGSILIEGYGYIDVSSKLISNPQNFTEWKTDCF